MLVQTMRSISCAILMALMLPSWSALAADGGSGLYLPGTDGDILVAIPPDPGLIASSRVFVQAGSVDAAVLQGLVDPCLDIDV